MFAPVPRPAEGDDLRLAPAPAPTTRCTLQAQRRGPAAGRAGLDGHHRRRPGHHAGRHGRRRARALDRRVDPAAVRAGRQPDHRRRREVREHEVLLHPQADAHQGEPRVRLPARRLRHARRDVRTAHAHPDRQGLAGADRVPRHARRPVLGDGARVRRAQLVQPRAGGRGRHRPVPHHRRLRGRRRRDHSASTATTTRCGTSATCW